MKPIFFLAILLSMLGAGHAVAQTPILAKDWVLQRPSLTAENLKSVAHNGSSSAGVISPGTDFVVVGGHGTILTAAGPITASTTWTMNTVPSGVGDLRDVTYVNGAGRFIAVGTLGSILTAPDTPSGTPAVLTWSKAGDTSFVATDAFDSVSAFGSTVVASGVTSASAGVIMVSTNSGSTWARKTVPSSTELKGVILSSSQQVYAIMDGAVQSSSNQGQTWTRISLPNTKVKSIALASPVGKSATVNITGDTNWQGTVSGGLITFAINSNTPTFPATTSVPGPGMPIAWSLNELVGIVPTGTLNNSTDGGTWISIGSTTNVTFNRAVKWANLSYLAVGNGGAIYSYVEGDAWNALTASGSTAYDALGVAWNERVDPDGSLTVAVGNNITWTSPDQGVTWTEHVQTTANMNMISVMWSGSIFVAAGSGLWTSPDGITWTSKATPPSPKTSGDPTVFTVARLYGDSASTPFALAYDPTKKAVMFSQGDSSGLGWSGFQALKGASTWAMLAITKKPDDSQYLAVGWGGHVLVSTNLTGTWTEHVAGLASGEDFTDVIWANDQYTAVTSKGGIWTSPTGTTWTKRHTAPQALWGVTRLKHPGGANDQFVAVGNHGVTATSYEGGIWTDGTLPTSQFINQAIWMPACTSTKKVHTALVTIETTTNTSYSLNTTAHILTTTVQVDTKTTTDFETTVQTILANDSPITVTIDKAKSQTVTTVKGTPSSTTADSNLTTAPVATTTTAKTTGTAPPDVDTTPSSNERLLTVGGTGAFFASTGAAAAQPTIGFVATQASDTATTIAEGTTTAAINLSLSSPVTDADVTLTLDFADSTLPASTYKADPTTFKWVKGDTTAKQFTITSNQDLIDRNNGKVVIKIKSANISGADVGVGTFPTYTVTITDDDFAPNTTVVASTPLVYVGSPVTLSAVLAANVVKTPTLQWLKNGAAIPGATQPMYTIPAAALANAGSYSVRAVNSAGTRTSKEVTLAVLDGSATTQYRKGTSSAVLSLKVAGKTLSYQWFSTTTGVLQNQALPTFTVPGDPTADTLSTPSYYCQVTSGTTTLSSGVFTLIPLQALSASVAGSADFVKVGSPVTFTATLTNANAVGPVSWQWYKGTAPIGGAVAQIYQIPSATLASAGEYSVKVSSPAGKGASLGGVQLAVLDGSPKTVYIKTGTAPVLTFPFATAGLPFTQQWSNTSGAISGANLPTYTVPALSTLPDSFTCTFTRASGTGISLTTGGIKVVQTGTNAKPVNVLADFATVKPMVGTSFSTQPRADNSPTSWTITGLPPGLDYNRTTGAVTGTPTASGTNFHVTLVASNGNGASAPTTYTVTVDPLLGGTAGTYMGIVAGDAIVNQGLGNRLDLTILASGAFTGKLTSVGGSTAFMGSLVPGTSNYDATADLLGGIHISLHIIGASGKLSGTVTKALGSATITDGWRKTAPASNSGKIANYTVAYAHPVTPPPNPNGAGYGFVTLDAAGNLTMRGKLADGSPTPYLTSSFVGPDTQTGIFVPVYNATGSLQGTMMISNLNSNPVTGTVNSGRIVGSATSATALDLTVDGAKFVAPSKGSNVIDGTNFVSVNLSFVGADLATAVNNPNCSFKITAPAVATLSGSNPAGTSLSINAATGEFTGTFIRDVATTTPVAAPARYAGFFGVLIAPSGAATKVGRGFFFEQSTTSPPTTLVGAANLDKAP